MVLGCDAHFLKKEDRYVHKAYLNSKDGEREVDDFYEYSYLQTEEEIKEHIEASDLNYEELVWTSEEIYRKIETYSLAHNQTIPKVEVKDYNKVEWQSEQSAEFPTLTKMFASEDMVERYWVNECFNKLEELGLSFGQKIDGVYLDKEEYEKLLEYKHMYKDLCK